MSITALRRPIGAKMNIATLSAAFTSVTITNSSGDALVTHTGHGLIANSNYLTPQWVYIVSKYEYGGWWYFKYIDANSYKLFRDADASGYYCKYVKDDLAAYSLLQNSSTDTNNTGTTKTFFFNPFVSVHDPIIYSLYNDRFPTNTVDTSQTVTSFDNVNGYVRLLLPGDISNHGNIFKYDWVKISGTASLDGLYQILGVTVQKTQFTINLLYSASYSFAGGTVSFYYNNYAVTVNVWAGLNSAHPLAAQKAYSKIATVTVIPDSNNIATVNIAQFVKKQLEVISNNALKATLPCDLDNFTQFYITYQDSYDSSDGSLITTASSSLTSDQRYCEGIAVNAKMDFKRRFVNWMDEYMQNVESYAYKAKWLNTQPDSIKMKDGRYFDLSFLNDFGQNIQIRKDLYDANNALIATTYEAVSDLGLGVYRYPVAKSGFNEARIDITVYHEQIAALAALSAWTNHDATNYAGNAGTAWATGASPSITLGVSGNSKLLITPYKGSTRGFGFNYNVTKGTNGVNLFVIPLDANFYPCYWDHLSAGGQPNIPNATGSGSRGMHPMYRGAQVAYVALYADSVGLAGSMTINSFTIDGNSKQSLTETKSIYIDKTNVYSGAPLTIGWLNNLGGWEWWTFTAKKVYGRNIEKTQEQRVNLLPDFPKTVGEFATTIQKEIGRTTRKTLRIRSQNLTKDQADWLATIKDSPCVQIWESAPTLISGDVSVNNFRTIIPDASAFDIREDLDKKWAVTFNARYTDEMPSQSQ